MCIYIVGGFYIYIYIVGGFVLYISYIHVQAIKNQTLFHICECVCARMTYDSLFTRIFLHVI